MFRIILSLLALIIFSCDSLDPIELIEGCTDDGQQSWSANPGVEACNYDASADIDDESCFYAEENFDCDGNCIFAIDCDGECAGNALLDSCGICNGDGSSCEVFIQQTLNTTIDESSLENLETFEDNFESLIETQLNLPSGSVEVTNITIVSTNRDDIQVEVDFTITLTEQELDETEFTSDDQINQLWEEVEDELVSQGIDFIYGCTNDTACNYNVEATIDDSSCQQPEEFFNCEGVCISEIDCYGLCGGTSVNDACGICDGTGYYDNCNVCDDDASNDCAQDCNGLWGGTAWESDCGCVNADNSGDECNDCAGNPNGDALIDNCGTCDNNILNDCVLDCAGTWGGDAYDQGCGCGVYDQLPTDGCDDSCGSILVNDCAGVCGGDSVLSGCDNTCNSILVNDCAGVCGGDSVIGGCDETCGSSLEFDECGECNGPGPNNGYDCNDNCIDSSICSSVILSLEVSETVATITYNSNFDIDEFMFTVSGINILNTNSGLDVNQFSNITGAVLGSNPFGGSALSSGSGTLLTIDFDGIVDGGQLSINGIAISFLGQLLSADSSISNVVPSCLNDDLDSICDYEDECIGYYDCFGTCNGSAYIDDCEVCSEGDSNHLANSDQDDCGLCFGPGYTDSCGTLCDECDISENSIYMTNSGELWYNISDDLYGFQLDLYGIDITSINGVDVSSSEFEITYENGTSFSRILAYTTSDNYISSGCGTLLQITYSGEVSDISNIIFGTAFGSSMQVDQYTCP